VLCSLGSNSLDLLLAEHFAKEFMEKGGGDVRCVKHSRVRHGCRAAFDVEVAALLQAAAERH
jgi:hypothetical protein